MEARRVPVSDRNTYARKNRKSPQPFLEMAVLEAKPLLWKSSRKKQVDVKLTSITVDVTG